jgi:hypothetical protein
MKGTIAAAAVALLLCSAARAARADDAYASLVGMAQAAASDRGPDAGAVPPGRAAPARRAGEPASRRAEPAAASSASPAAGEVLRDAVGAPSALPASAASAVPPAAVLPGGLRGAWVRLYATLAPSPRRVPSFEAPAVSTAAARVAPAPPARPDPAAAGARRGLNELLSAASAPVDPR